MSQDQEQPEASVEVLSATEASSEAEAATLSNAEISTNQPLDVVSIEGQSVADAEQPGAVAVEQGLAVDSLQKALAAAEGKAQEHWDKALRIQAEMENLKRRTQKDLEDAHKFALTNFVKELLPVLDSLLLGLQAATSDHPEVQKFREGSELTLKQFESVFAKFNITLIEDRKSVV